MADTAVWKVDLYVIGPVAVQNAFRTTQQKGFDVTNPFYSDIEISNVQSSGLKAVITARASDDKLASQAARYFFGKMLDVLTFLTNQPLYLSLSENNRRQERVSDTRRIIKNDEIADAFTIAHQLGTNNHTFLRSMGWYRKGLYTDDPFDKFLAFWNTIEIVASKYCNLIEGTDKERAKNGCISQTWECFKKVWGECCEWPLITDQRNWIDANYETRNGVVHGSASVDVKKVSEVVLQLQTIEQVAYRFLGDWYTNFVDCSSSNYICEDQANSSPQ